jgi:lipopolysaccharide export system protein LptA
MAAGADTPLSDLQRIASRPSRVRRLAVFSALGLLSILILGYIWSSSNPEFKMKGLPPTLSNEVSAVVTAYSRREVAPDGSSFNVIADRATTYTDNHQRLEGVKIEFPGAQGVDTLSAKEALFIPGAERAFKIFLEDEVVLSLADGLTVRSAAMVFDGKSGKGETAGAVEFRRGEVSGSSEGATFDSVSRRVDFVGRVSVLGTRSANNPDSDLSRLGISGLRLTGEKGWIEAKDRSIQLSDGVKMDADVDPASKGLVPNSISTRSLEIRFDETAPTEIVASGALNAKFLPTALRQETIDVNGDSLRVNLKNGEEELKLSGGGSITIRERSGDSVRIAGKSVGYRPARRQVFGDGGISLERETRGAKQTGRANRADYSILNGEFRISGGARFDSAPDFFQADLILGKLDSKQNLVAISGEGDALIGREDASSRTETTARRFDARFAQAQILKSVVVAGPANSTHRPKRTGGGISSLGAPKGMRLEFDATGSASELQTQGRSSLRLSDEQNSDAPVRALSSDQMKVSFNPLDQSLRTAEATGNAEIILPEVGGRASTKIASQDFLCDFAPGLNRVRECRSSSKATAVRQSNAEVQNLEASRFALIFDIQSNTADLMQAVGRARFSQGSSFVTGDQISYRFKTEVASISGGPVQFWDSRGRSRSRLVEWETRSRVITLSGDVSTTYYNQVQAGEAVPFREKEKPVYVTASRGILKPNDDSAVFSGKARVWQKDNFISAESIEIRRKARVLIASGGVRTLLFEVPGSVAGLRSSVTGLAGEFRYDDGTRIATYSGNVDLRQGSERLQAQNVSAKVGPDGGLEWFRAKGQVTMTQPGRKATGDEVDYGIAERKVSLRGSPARVSEAGRGVAEGSSVVYYLDERRVVGEGKSEANPKGRVRSVYQIDR